MNTRIPLTGMAYAKVAAEVRINADAQDDYGVVIFYSGCTTMQAYATAAQLRGSADIAHRQASTTKVSAPTAMPP